MGLCDHSNVASLSFFASANELDREMNKHGKLLMKQNITQN